MDLSYPLGIYAREGVVRVKCFQAFYEGEYSEGEVTYRGKVYPVVFDNGIAKAVFEDIGGEGIPAELLGGDLVFRAGDEVFTVTAAEIDDFIGRVVNR